MLDAVGARARVDGGSSSTNSRRGRASAESNEDSYSLPAMNLTESLFGESS